MAIRQLSLNDFRNLQSTTVDFHPHFNLITGLNGSGKTSALEAIHVISQGQSFKTRHLDQCIQYGKNSFLLFGLFENHKVGVSRSSHTTTIRLDSEPLQRRSLLIQKSPALVIDSNCFNLVLGKPSTRRQFLDWCLFHVEHNYHRLWLEFSHALKQRNALLKSRKELKQLDYWDEYLADRCAEIKKHREQCTENICRILEDEFLTLFDTDGLSVSYIPGWQENSDLLNVFRKEREKDLKYGFTHSGIHRDDLRITFSNVPVQQSLSRGQLKKLSIALILSQLVFVKKTTDKSIILLIDDLHSELDSHSFADILEYLSSIVTQQFMTDIDNTNRRIVFPKDYKMFHVEHGMIKPVKTP